MIHRAMRTLVGIVAILFALVLTTLSAALFWESAQPADTYLQQDAYSVVLGLGDSANGGWSFTALACGGMLGSAGLLTAGWKLLRPFVRGEELDRRSDIQ